MLADQHNVSAMLPEASSWRRDSMTARLMAGGSVAPTGAA